MANGENPDGCDFTRYKSFYLDRLSCAPSQSKCRISGHNHLFLFGVVECVIYWLDTYTEKISFHIKVSESCDVVVHCQC